MIEQAAKVIVLNRLSERTRSDTFHETAQIFGPLIVRDSQSPELPRSFSSDGPASAAALDVGTHAATTIGAASSAFSLLTSSFWAWTASSRFFCI